MITAIVSAYNRIENLRVVLASLKIQTYTDFEVIVAENSTDENIIRAHKEIIDSMKDGRFRMVICQKEQCYSSAEFVVDIGEAKGDYLCFPSDDDYYVERFFEFMMAGIEDNDIVLCNTLYDNDPVQNKNYYILEAQPKSCQVDKGGFIVKKDVFEKIKFPGKGPSSASDGLFVEEVAKNGKVKVLQEIMFVHG